MAMEPQSQALVDGLNASGLLPMHQQTHTQVREKLATLRPPRPAESPVPIFSVVDETITTPEGSFAVRVMRPRPNGEGETMPVVLYFHGGGYFLGDLDQVDYTCRKIARDADTVVVNVDYRLAPEAKFPAAINDGYASLQWVHEHAERLGVDPSRVVLCGDSAGGNLSIVLALLARDQGGPAVAFQALIYPSTDLRARPQYPSRVTLGKKDHFLLNDDIEWMLDLYTSTEEERSDWRVSPVVAESYKGLPPALVVTADHDPLVDEGKEYADRLKADGVAAEYVCFEGTFHGFVGFAPVLEVGMRGLDLVSDRIRRAVHPEDA